MRKAANAPWNAAGLSSEFRKLMRPEGDRMRLADKTGFIHIDEDTPGEKRPEIDRVQLRQLLIDSVPAKSIEWSSKVAQAFSLLQTGDFRIIFANGSEDPRNFDFVVGADGAWSHVRPLVTDVLPFYSGISSVEVRFRDVDKAHPEISSWWDKETYCCLSDEKACFGQRQGDGSIRNYAMLRAPESWIDDCGIDFSNPQATKAAMVERYFDDWSEANKDLIRLADEDYVIARKLVMLPTDHRWTSRPGVTLMGGRGSCHDTVCWRRGEQRNGGCIGTGRKGSCCAARRFSGKDARNFGESGEGIRGSDVCEDPRRSTRDLTLFGRLFLEECAFGIQGDDGRVEGQSIVMCRSRIYSLFSLSPVVLYRQVSRLSTGNTTEKEPTQHSRKRNVVTFCIHRSQNSTLDPGTVPMPFRRLCQSGHNSQKGFTIENQWRISMELEMGII